MICAYCTYHEDCSLEVLINVAAEHSVCKAQETLKKGMIRVLNGDGTHRWDYPEKLVQETKEWIHEKCNTNTPPTTVPQKPSIVNKFHKTKKLNINEYVKVKLNETGLDIYIKRMKEINESLKEKGTDLEFPLYPVRDDKGYVKFQLWDLMELFGEYLRVGEEIPFENNSIYIESSDLK